jgi:drug/metabolite transporter (DMT)-like permease
MNLKPVVSVLLSAALFGVSTPLAKLLLGDVRPLALAGLLYLGVFLGLGGYSVARRAVSPQGGSARGGEARLEKKDLPWLAGAVLAGGIIGPICLMEGLSRTSGFSASLLLNFEGLATALVAVFLFRENAGRRTWLALAMMTAAGVLLSWNPGQGRFDLTGPVLVLLAMIGWGLDNNLTRQISDKDPVEIARVKGLAAGAVSTAAAFILGQGYRLGPAVAYGLLIGAVCYGLSLVLFIRALKGLGAFRTGAFFSLAPFAGSVASLVILKESVGWTFAAAALMMIAGVALIVGEKHSHSHRHLRSVHAHSHAHGDLHHFHLHTGEVREPHTHEHFHEGIEHVHGHWPDTHHRHGH